MQEPGDPLPKPEPQDPQAAWGEDVGRDFGATKFPFELGNYRLWVPRCVAIGQRLEEFNAQYPNRALTVFGTSFFVTNEKAMHYLSKPFGITFTIAPEGVPDEDYQELLSQNSETFVRNFVEAYQVIHEYDLREAAKNNWLLQALGDDYFIYSACWFGAYLIAKNPVDCRFDSITWALRHPDKPLPEPLTPQAAWIFLCYRDHFNPEIIEACIFNFREFYFLPREVVQLHITITCLLPANLCPPKLPLSGKKIFSGHGK